MEIYPYHDATGRAKTKEVSPWETYPCLGTAGRVRIKEFLLWEI